MSDHLVTPLDAYRLTPDLLTRAVATVAHYATSPEEAREFCQALGLLPTERTHPGARDDLGRMTAEGRP